MFASENVHTISLVIDADPVGGNDTYYLMKAPKALTIKSAYMTSEQTQNAGTAVKLRLENWGTAGTAVEGTVTAYLGGTATAAVLTARVPSAAATIDSAQDEIDENEWLVVYLAEEGAGWIANDRFTFTVNYVIGKGA